MDLLKAFEVFIAVAEAESFAGASRALFISPPSVTRIIRELEENLGAVLFHRTTRIVSLTDIGKVYHEDVKRILHDIEVANDAARGAHRAPKGHLRVTASTLFGQIYITPIVTEYLNIYKDVTVEGMYLDRVVNLVDEGLDIAIRIGNLPDSSLIAKRVGSVRPVVCATPVYLEKHGLPKKPKDLLSGHHLISLKLPNSRPEWRFKDENIKFKPQLELTSVPAAIAASLSGWGIVRALSYQVGPELEKGTLKTILDDYAPPALPIHILYGEGRRASAKVRSFVDFAAEKLGNNPVLNK